MPKRAEAYAIKAGIDDPDAVSWTFAAQKTMYGGKLIREGDPIFVFSDEGTIGLIAKGVVAHAEATPRRQGVERQTPRVSITVNRIAGTTRRLGRIELTPYNDWNDGRPETELNFKCYRQATGKIVGLSHEAAEFLSTFFQPDPD